MVKLSVTKMSAPDKAIEQAAKFARQNGIPERVIRRVSGWRWLPDELPHTIYVAMHTEKEREFLSALTSDPPVSSVKH